MPEMPESKRDRALSFDAPKVSKPPRFEFSTADNTIKIMGLREEEKALCFRDGARPRDILFNIPTRASQIAVPFKVLCYDGRVREFLAGDYLIVFDDRTLDGWPRHMFEAYFKVARDPIAHAMLGKPANEEQILAEVIRVIEEAPSVEEKPKIYNKDGSMDAGYMRQQLGWLVTKEEKVAAYEEIARKAQEPEPVSEDGGDEAGETDHDDGDAAEEVEGSGDHPDESSKE